MKMICKNCGESHKIPVLKIYSLPEYYVCLSCKYTIRFSRPVRIFYKTTQYILLILLSGFWGAFMPYFDNIFKQIHWPYKIFVLLTEAILFVIVTLPAVYIPTYLILYVILKKCSK